VDTTDPEGVEAALRPETKMLWIETPTNPMLTISDIALLSEMAHGRGATVAVDNTFASPYFQQPLSLGADIVVHSTTKYMGGHSDVVGGSAVTSNPDLHERMAFYQNAAGAVPGPFDSWIVLRGLKTLAVRMRQHDESGRAVAAFLEENPKVEKLYYPGSLSHRQHDLARRQQRGFGGMVSFDVGSLENARTVLEAVRVCTLAESLGGVESLISHPATMTHASVLPETRQRIGITDGLVRISVGLEDTEDIIADLDQALAKI